MLGISGISGYVREYQGSRIMVYQPTPGLSHGISAITGYVRIYVRSITGYISYIREC